MAAVEGFVHGGRRQIGGRAAAAVASQTFSSLQSYVVLFAALHTLHITQFGVFTLAYTTAPIVLVLVRSLLLEPLSIRFTTALHMDRKRATQGAAGASLTSGLIILGGCIFAGLVAGGPVRGVLLSVGFLIPPLLLQDVWRYHLLAAGRGWSAAVNDALCFVVTLGVVAIAGFAGGSGVGKILFFWTCGSAVGAVVGMRQAKVWPSFRTARTWFSESRHLGVALAGEKGLELVSSQAAFVLVGVVVNVTALGILGAARTVMAPVTTVMLSVTLFALPEAARMRGSRRHLQHFAAAVSAFAAVAVLLYSVAVYAAPEAAMRALVGENWDIAKTVLPPVAVWTAALGARQGPSTALRALEKSGVVFALSAATGASVVIGAVGGAYIGKAGGAAWGFALVYVASTVAYWVVYVRSAKGKVFGGNRVPPVD